MNEEIEYAEMLEIPVSTVNVVRKKRSKKRKSKPVAEESVTPTVDLKETVIEKVNDKLETDEKITADAKLFAESANSEGTLDLGDIPDRIDTVRLYSDGEYERIRGELLQPEEYHLDDEESEKDGGMYALNEETPSQRRVRICLGAEFAVACALCGAIFLTNVFMPNSAINTFFRALGTSETTASADERGYEDFTLTSAVSALSDAELSLSETGVLSIKGETLVYPVCDGKVKEIKQAQDGSYTLTVAYSERFSGEISGLDTVYYAVDENVFANVPVGFSDGETDVQMTMFSDDEALECLQLTEENCLAWLAQE
jgi:hypothetical protein